MGNDFSQNLTLFLITTVLNRSIFIDSLFSKLEHFVYSLLDPLLTSFRDLGSLIRGRMTQIRLRVRVDKVLSLLAVEPRYGLLMNGDPLVDVAAFVVGVHHIQVAGVGEAGAGGAVAVALGEKVSGQPGGVLAAAAPVHLVEAVGQPDGSGHADRVVVDPAWRGARVVGGLDAVTCGAHANGGASPRVVAAAAVSVAKVAVDVVALVVLEHKPGGRRSWRPRPWSSA